MANERSVAKDSGRKSVGPGFVDGEDWPQWNEQSDVPGGVRLVLLYRCLDGRFAAAGFSWEIFFACCFCVGAEQVLGEFQRVASINEGDVPEKAVAFVGQREPFEVALREFHGATRKNRCQNGCDTQKFDDGAHVSKI